MSERIGLIGLGIMGAGMARNLLAGGFDLTVWNRTPGRADDLVADGARGADDVAALADASDVLVLCVSDTPDVLEVVDRLEASLRPGQLVIDCSTISPDATRKLHARTAEFEVGWVDAPVSGGSEGAREGTLSIMVGGDDHDVARARPVLAPFARTITHVGGPGAGQACKLVNQILVTTTMLGVSEALVFAASQGLDLDATIDAVSGGAAGSWMLEQRGPQVVDDYWEPGFTVDLQQKDLRLVLEAADRAGVPLLSTPLVFQLYRTLQAEGRGGEGNHALVKAIEKLAGTEARRNR